MAEGGLFPWKLQKIWTRPTADYSNLDKPLPPPPQGMVWEQNEKTKEYKLVKETEKESKVEANAVLVAEQQEEQLEPELTEEAADVVVDTLPSLPPRDPSSCHAEDEWELLSDRFSCSSHAHSNTSAIFVSKAGSVRSIASLEDQDHGSHTTPVSVPFKIQRTLSSSTIDSTDNVLGPAGKGVLGVDYVEHVILPTDTLQGICLAYKIGSTRLRQANHFSGNSLLLAPKKLVIPLSKKALRSGFIRVQDTDAKEYKLHAFLFEFADLSLTEAKAYLELADWVLDDAIESAREDNEWEQDIDTNELKAGEIRFTMNKMGLHAAGAGILSTVSQDEDDDEQAERRKANESAKKNEKPIIIAYTGIPAIATKTVKAQDVYKAAPQHESFGVELQPLIAEKKAIPETQPPR